MNLILRNVILTLLVSAGLLAVLFYARPENNNQSQQTLNQNILFVDKPNHDFGTISMKDGIVRTKFNIKNTEPGEMRISKMYTSCMCTEATLFIGGEREGPFGMIGHGIQKMFDRRLNPGEEAEIEVAFDPAAHGPAGIGRIERQVILEGPGGILMEVSVRANVTP